MPKRFATAGEIKAAPVLPVTLPPSNYESDPISVGETPEMYCEIDLKKAAKKKHGRTDEFEKRLVAIWWLNDEQPVPFIFRTLSGKLRSLDAGCLGFLINKKEPECEIHTDSLGFVVAVTPRPVVVARYLPIKNRLLELISRK